MTATEWAVSTDPEPMLRFARPAATGRKRILFAFACCCRVADWLIEEYTLSSRRKHYPTRHRRSGTVRRREDIGGDCAACRPKGRRFEVL